MSIAGIDLRFAYGDEGDGALNGVSVEVAPRELVAILGPNGSGKSTLLKSLAGVLRPQSGSVLLDGTEVRRLPRREHARRVGYLPQEIEAAFPVRALDAVASGRAPHLGRFQWESEADLQAAREALELCDASHLAERVLDEMSGGERKRVFLARVLAGNPDFVLLDEPLAALDVAHVESVARLMRRLVERDGHGVAFVSHDFNWAAAFSDRVVVMSAGRVVAHGPPAAVLTRELMRDVFGLRAEILHGAGGVGWIVPALDSLPIRER